MARAVLALGRASAASFLRDRGPLAALAVVVASLGLAVLLTGATIGSSGRLLADFGWFAAGVGGWALAIGYGSGLADRGGVLGPLALASPVGAGTVVLGRFLGLAAGLAAFAALATVLLVLALENPVAAAGWLLFLRLVVVLSLSTFLASVLRPGPAALLAAPTALAGWLPADPGGCLAAAGRMLLPRLALLAPPGGEPVALAGPTLHAVAYSAGMLALAALLTGPVRRRRGDRG